jgi:hypothetical protein
MRPGLSYRSDDANGWKVFFWGAGAEKNNEFF